MWLRITCGCLFIVVLLGCTQAVLRPISTTVTVDELLADTEQGQPGLAQPLVDEADVLAVSPEMRQFLDSNVDLDAGSFIKLHQLLGAIITEGTFGLEYDERTRTAAETFAARRGNCLSFSNMFVAMARYSGLTVSYQEVDIPPDWTFENDAFVLNRHVNILVDLGITGEHVVDFNIEDFRASYDRRAISDTRALAHFYNNMGVESMQDGDLATALAYFHRAIVDHDRRFSPAWNNLGILYLREGRLAFAEAAFLQALKVDIHDDVAMSSLADLYARMGQQEQATRYRLRVVSHRRQNPYYRYQLAREAFLAHHYDVAIGHLKYAVHKKPNEDRFCFLLGLAHLQNGNDRAAARWLARAKEVAATDELKRKYDGKLNILKSSAK